MVGLLQLDEGLKNLSGIKQARAMEVITMDADDLEPQARKIGPKNLEIMSIEALDDYIAELEAEITRVRSAIKEKHSARNGAETFFK